MKSLSLLALGVLLVAAAVLPAQESLDAGGRMPTADTKWPGIKFSIYRLERILDGRLLVWVRVIATSQAPGSGTLLGGKPEIPSTATRDEIAAGLYNPKPFSLASAIMIDDQTQRKYPVLSPIAPPGVRYFPGELANGLIPGQAYTLTIQFAAPPPPPDLGSGRPGKQTVSFVLPGAKGPISRVTVPPPSET
jgi:hypothetical protein